MLAGAAYSAEPPPGKQLFDRYCGPCHAATVGTPGTQQLTWTRGKDSGLLEKRKDLSADYIRSVVRNGLFEMPPFRPTEITDAQLTELANYLAQAAKPSGKH